MAGAGQLIIQAIQFADVPVMAAYLVMIALIFVVINLTVDSALLRRRPTPAYREDDGERGHRLGEDKDGGGRFRKRRHGPASGGEGWLARARDSDLWHSFTRAWLVMAAAAIVVVIVTAAGFAPWLAPYQPFDPATLNLLDAATAPMGESFSGSLYVLGTDDQGRDLLSTIMYGARISLFVGFSSIMFAMLLGVSLGLISGYLGGAVDAVIMRIADVQLSFPAILIALLVDGVARTVVPRELHDQIGILVLVLRDRHLQLGSVRAHRAQLDAGREEQGVRAGGASHRGSDLSRS